jgi:hypothetical protein
VLRSVWRFAVLICAGCAAGGDSRAGRILDSLAEDNYAWAARDPELVAMKLHKMQRGPYEWLRGTAQLYWRDVTEPGAARAATAFGSPEASRVLLVGDPHVENIGTFRATDGTMFIDWNDFDGTGYGPYQIDVRRLGASLALVAELGGDTARAAELVRAAATRYAETIRDVHAGTQIAALDRGAKLFEKELEKSRARGDARYGLDEVSVFTGTALDLEPVAGDGVFEDHLAPVGAEQADWIDRAIAQWDPGAKARVRMRRIGSGVASYAAYRFDVILEDDRFIELKETRDGVIIPNVPRLHAAEWASPAVRAVDTQKRLHARPDGDPLLGAAQVGALSLKIRDREAYQRGIDAPDLVELVTKDFAELRTIAELYGALLARAHGQALTADGVPGHTVIAPLLTGREAAFVDEIVAAALADAARIRADYELMKDRDLASAITEVR